MTATKTTPKKPTNSEAVAALETLKRFYDNPDVGIVIHGMGDLHCWTFDDAIEDIQRNDPDPDGLIDFPSAYDLGGEG